MKVKNHAKITHIGQCKAIEPLYILLLSRCLVMLKILSMMAKHVRTLFLLVQIVLVGKEVRTIK